MQNEGHAFRWPELLKDHHQREPYRVRYLLFDLGINDCRLFDQIWILRL